NVTYTVTSKRYLLQLVIGGLVDGWDDPRLPTVCGLRRRGYTPESIKAFCERIGLARSTSLIEVEVLEQCIRDDLNESTPRVMVVLDPVKVVIDNYPGGQVEWMDAENHPQKPEMGTRTVPFSREIYIEREDFMENPSRKYYRLSPGREVRLKYAYYITCTDVMKDADGQVVELHCTYDPESRGGSTPDGRRVRGTLHWVSVPHALDAEVRLYDRLFLTEDPFDVDEEVGESWLDNINPDAKKVLTGCKAEPSLGETTPGERYQFMRQGYFCTDPDSTPDALVFNRTIALRDSWAKIKRKTPRR
ncbi:MAG: glutamate--tRNA ligase family protein, partial [Anaerolineae bacterium]|nr:glutamate--tRNA ligase family protein [Anaerolineae bacterium]